MAHEPLEHTVLETKFTEIQEACLRADVVIHTCMIDAFHFVSGCVSVPVDGEVSLINAICHTVEVSELEAKEEDDIS